MGDFFLGKVYFTSPLLLMHWTSVCGHTVRQKRGMSNRVACHFDLNSITLLSTNRGHKRVLLEAKMKTLKPNPYFMVHYHSYNAGFDCKKGHSSTHTQLYMIVRGLCFWSKIWSSSKDSASLFPDVFGSNATAPCPEYDQPFDYNLLPVMFQPGYRLYQFGNT